VINAFNDIPAKALPQPQGIGGLTDLRSVAALQVGSGSKAFKSDDSGIWLGAKKFADAPFSVTMAGVVTASGFIVTGGAATDVNNNVTTISGGKITTNSITATQIASSTITGGQIASTTITGGNIATSTITATQIATSTITADKMNVSTLSTISANIGTITAGTITASSQISVGGIHIVGGGITVDNNTGVNWYDTGGTLNALVKMDNGNTLILFNYNGKVHVYSNNDEVELISNNGTCFLGDTSQKAHMNDPIYVGGVAKSAIVNTKLGFRKLYCMESPEVWFMDFCKSKTSIDPLFRDVTEGEYKFIKLDDGSYQVWRHRKEMGHKRLETSTEIEYNKNNKFWSIPFQ